MDEAIERRLRTTASEQHGLLTRAQIQTAGVTPDAVRNQVRRGAWERLPGGVMRLAGAPLTWQGRVLAAVLAAGPHAAASHWTAAALHRIPGFAPGLIEVTVARNRSDRRRTRGVHETGLLPAGHLKVVDAITVTSVARTLFDLCGSVHPLRAERAVDNCVSRKLVTVPALWRVLDDLAEHGRSGTVLMRELLEARGSGYVAPASQLERRMLSLLEDAGLPRPAREVDVGDCDQWVGRVELVYREAKLLIEVDSRLHHTSLSDREADQARDNKLMAAGWRVLRVTDEMLDGRPFEIVLLVRRALVSSAA